MGTLQEKIGSRIKLKVILLFLSTVLIMNNSICAEPTVSEKDLLRKELIFSDKEEAYRYLGVTLQKLTEVIKITKAELAKLVKKAENNTNDVTMNDAKPVKVKVDEISKIEVALEKLQEKEEIRRLKSEILKLIREIGEVTELAFPLFGDVMARRETAIESAPKNAIVMPKVVKSHLGDLSDSLLGVERSLVVLQQAI